MRIKALPKSMRWRYRYLLVVWRGKLKGKEILRALERWMGKMFFRSADIRIVGEGNEHCIVRVRREYEWLVRASLALERFEGAIVKVEKSSGTVAGLRRKSKILINV